LRGKKKIENSSSSSSSSSESENSDEWRNGETGEKGDGGKDKFRIFLTTCLGNSLKNQYQELLYSVPAILSEISGGPVVEGGEGDSLVPKGRIEWSGKGDGKEGGERTMIESSGSPSAESRSPIIPAKFSPQLPRDKTPALRGAKSEDSYDYLSFYAGGGGGGGEREENRRTKRRSRQRRSTKLKDKEKDKILLLQSGYEINSSLSKDPVCKRNS
jgi:hypothetical protein